MTDVLKNARLAEDAARAAGSSHPLMTASRELYEEAAAAGLGHLDMIAVIAALDERAGVDPKGALAVQVRDGRDCESCPPSS